MEYHSEKHHHPLRKSDIDNGWACNGIQLPGGCRGGCTGFNQTTGWIRYKCIHESCNFDLCEACLTNQNTQNREYRSEKHLHPLKRCMEDNGWACNGIQLPGGCRGGCTGFNQTTGWVRYRCICEGCNFDLCEACLTNQGLEIKEYLSSQHPHPLRKNYRDNGWACNGRRLPGGCRSGCTAINQTTGWVRYRCINETCDFDLCEACLMFYNIGNQEYLSTVHSHPLIKCNRDNGWACNGRSLAGGCRSGCTAINQTTGWVRYRCINEICDFDLCEGCLKFYTAYR